MLVAAILVAEHAVEMDSACFQVTMVLFWHAAMGQRDVLDMATGWVSVDHGSSRLCWGLSCCVFNSCLQRII